MQVIASTTSSTNYTKIADPRGDIIFGRARAVRDTSSKAELEIFGSTGSITGNQESQITSSTAAADRVQVNSEGLTTLAADNTKRIQIKADGINFLEGATTSADTHTALRFYHNPGVIDGGGTESFTSIYRQGTADSAPGAGGKGRNIVIRDGRTGTTVSADGILERSRLVLYDMSLESERCLLSTGGNSNPVYTFIDETDTGMYRRAEHLLAFSVDGTKRGEFTTSGFDVVGAISKTSGDFKIDHPLDSENKYLFHGFIEGAKYDLLYRGFTTLTNGTATVNIDTASNMSNGTFAALTQNPDYFLQNKTGWDAVKGAISGNTLTITCQNNNSTDTISWLVVAERADDHIKTRNVTDEDGHLIPEHLKSDID